MKKILLMLTGGTICSFVDDDGFKDTDYKKAAPILLDAFKKNNAGELDIEFEVMSPLSILSENMTFNQWNVLLKAIGEIKWSDYEGVIISHGTDTLAYTASLLSMVLAGCQIPVFIVSSNFSLADERANGNDNFRAAVGLISDGIVPDVYVTYKNDDGIIYLHRGAEITQCQNYTWNFYSKNMVEYSHFNKRGEPRGSREMLIHKIGPLRNNVLMIEPYVGTDYSVYNLEGKKAVLHGLFHSSTACVGAGEEEDKNRNSSILYLIDKCKERGVGFYIAPFEKELLAGETMYSSTAALLKSGAIPIVGMSKEVCYAKIVIACALFADQDKIAEFLKEEINEEMIY